MRGDIRPGLRVLGYRRRVAIPFLVEDCQVSILGVFYGGQDYGSLLADITELD
jgi:plasmid stabilization system protein ParE